MSILIEWDILSIGATHTTFPVQLDGIAVLFSATVLLIARRVLLFSIGYRRDDLNLTRFTWIVLLFVLAMNALIYSPNIFTLLLG